MNLPRLRGWCWGLQHKQGQLKVPLWLLVLLQQKEFIAVRFRAVLPKNGVESGTEREGLLPGQGVRALQLPRVEKQRHSSLFAAPLGLGTAGDAGEPQHGVCGDTSA